MCKIKSVRIYV
uniref:Uncharacterized protein n=1 Tax=Arundo donax TaxID=35708 RepID=A0A0A9BZN6_ARUDO